MGRSSVLLLWLGPMGRVGWLGEDVGEWREAEKEGEVVAAGDGEGRAGDAIFSQASAANHVAKWPRHRQPTDPPIVGACVWSGPRVGSRASRIELESHKSLSIVQQLAASIRGLT